MLDNEALEGITNSCWMYYSRVREMARELLRLRRTVAAHEAAREKLMAKKEGGGSFYLYATNASNAYDAAYNAAMQADEKGATP